MKVLKAKLSEYLRLVKAGEVVLVTERDEVIAELRPANRQKVESTDWSSLLDELASENRVVLRAAEPESWPESSFRGQLGSGVLDSVLEDLRADKKAGRGRE